MGHKKALLLISCHLSLFHIYLYTINTDKRPPACKCDDLKTGLLTESQENQNRFQVDETSLMKKKRFGLLFF